MSEQDLFGSFDRPSFETPEMLLYQHGEAGLQNMLTELTKKQDTANQEVDIARQLLDEKIERSKELCADRDMVQSALRLARDRGLE